MTEVSHAVEGSKENNLRNIILTQARDERQSESKQL